MIGHIESYDKNVQTGVIKYEGKFYEFYIDVWTSETPPQAGDDVDFLMEADGTVTEVGLVGAYIKDMRPVKLRWLATVLSLLCLHRFYLGFYMLGIAQVALLLLTGGFGIVWAVIEGFLIATGHIHKDAKGRPFK
jgi:hypothetical protein